MPQVLDLGHSSGKCRPPLSEERFHPDAGVFQELLEHKEQCRVAVRYRRPKRLGFECQSCTDRSPSIGAILIKSPFKSSTRSSSLRIPALPNRWYSSTVNR